MTLSSRACLCFFFLMIRRPPRSTLDRSSAASDVYKRQVFGSEEFRQAVAIARLDNLGKGASGAAVQNLKLMFGLE
mgnify:CR=1 FL=1